MSCFEGVVKVGALCWLQRLGALALCDVVNAGGIGAVSHSYCLLLHSLGFEGRQEGVLQLGFAVMSGQPLESQVP